MSEDSVQERIRVLMSDLGYVDREGRLLFTFHGLRKNATNHLAELGCSHHEISAMNGMDVNTVIHYTRAVNRRLLAVNVADRIKGSSPRRDKARLKLVA